MKTFSLKKENIERQWYVVDASDKVLGRLSTKIADRIRGKENLKGQTGRYWWRIQKLQRQLFDERMKAHARSRRQWFPP